MSKLVITLLLIVAAIALLSLALGASYLETMLPGGLPLGNALTAIGLCAAASSAVGLSAGHIILRRVSVAALIGAVTWLPASIALAGNLTLNFHGGYGVAWLILSLVVVATVLCALIGALVATLLAKFRRAGSTQRCDPADRGR